MAYNQGPNVRTDKFGRAYQLKTLYEKVTKTGELINGVFKGHVELGGKLYEIEVSDRHKETKRGGNAMWCKVTVKPKQHRQTSM